MNSLDQHRLYNLQLLARNEGKIKTYESCEDVRAWSHDLRQRDRYLREWIKCDMPLCVVPVSTLVGFFRNMTCKSNRKTTPRCHPDCKSKVILDSITASCEAMRECLKADRNLNKFFCEEELESSHWPCERCLEALKNIKLFWKILLEKVFAINLTKDECSEQRSCFGCDSVRDVARFWEEDMVHQAMFVKTLTPKLICSNFRHDTKCCKKSCLKSSGCRIDSQSSQSNTRLGRLNNGNNSDSSRCQHNSKQVTINCSTHCVSNKEKSSRKKECKCISARVKTADACCDTASMENCEILTSQMNLESLQRDYDSQKYEIEKLRKENRCLRTELQNGCSGKWKSPVYCAATTLVDQDNGVLVPKPFESLLEEACASQNMAKDADSELIITMKNCKQESFRHVSLLQVLHKSNDPYLQDNYSNVPCYKHEDPVKLLTKVQTTLGAMVKREMALARSKKKCGSNSEITASFESMNSSKPSCSELSSRFNVIPK